MYISITGSTMNKAVYIYQSYRKENGKTSSKIYRKLGKLNDLLNQFDGNYDAMMTWAKSEAQNQERCFKIGYLFLQKLCAELQIESICRKISKRYKYSYDFSAIVTDLVFSRILAPSSKLSSFSYCQTLLEPPKYELQNVYRALSVMAKARNTVLIPL